MKNSIKHLKPRAYIPAKTMPLDVGVIHLVGIGGIGMSGIAEILHNLGYKVSGSDLSLNPNAARLQDMGVTIYIGQEASNVVDAAVVVKSTAVPLTNPEIVAAREAGIPVLRRSEMLAELTGLKASIAVAGSHGKTTTTSMIAHILDSSGKDPTVINGGIINTYGTNARLGSGDWLVVEADESDGTFINIPATIGIINNLDPEHLDYWGDYDALKDAFKTFINNLPFYGVAVCCLDDVDVANIANQVQDRRVVSYGIDYQYSLDVRAENIEYKSDMSQFDVVLSDRLKESLDILTSRFTVQIPIPGKHNILNVLAAITVALELKLTPVEITDALIGFEGVKRRFTNVGIWNNVSIIDDYAHHPVEIAATMQAAREVLDKGTGGKLIAVMQPHRYSRLESLFIEFSNCFDKADIVIVSDVFEAGEQPIEGVDGDALVEALKAKNITAFKLPSEDKLAMLVRNHAKAGDMVVCMGAGSITKWAADLAENLAK